MTDTGSLKDRSIDNLETQKKFISMTNSQFFEQNMRTSMNFSDRFQV
jgi:hypothetical protein